MIGSPAVMKRMARNVAVMAAVAMLAACEGDNLFKGNPPVSEGPPTITFTQVPESARLGSTFDLSLSATSTRGITSIDLRFVSGVELDTDTIRFDPPRATATVAGTFTLPDQVGDSILVIHARAVQVGGRVSLPASRTLRILPALSSPAAPGSD